MAKKKLFTEKNEDPDSIESLVECRLIPLSKDPGVRPIGIGEVLRRIIGKAIVIKEDIMMSVVQPFCNGAEIAIRAATELFEDDASHGILQIDANNPFNSLNQPESSIS